AARFDRRNDVQTGEQNDGNAGDDMFSVHLKEWLGFSVEMFSMTAEMESAGRCNASSNAPKAVCSFASLSSCASAALLNSSCAANTSRGLPAPALSCASADCCCCCSAAST